MFLRILKHECIASEYGRDEDLQLHVCQVLTHTRPVIHDDRVVDSLASGTRSTVSLTLGHTKMGGTSSESQLDPAQTIVRA